MEWILNNWYVVVGLISIVIVVIVCVLNFYKLPTKQQIANIKEWLLYAVTEAERQLGTGTGAMKLRMVYDWTVEKFPCVSFIDFDTFSDWVDEALEEMKVILSTNEHVKNYVNNK